jgi:arginase
MEYPKIEINLDVIRGNAAVLAALCEARGITIAGVVKSTCGSPAVASAMLAGGVKHIADSRLENLERLRNNGINSELMLLRSPMKSQIAYTVKTVDISLNSELEIIEMLSAEALRQRKIHDIILMIDLGDRREGLMPDDVIPAVGAIVRMPGIRLSGIGTNLTCFGGVLPSPENMRQLSDLATEIETAHKMKLRWVSGGNSSSLKMIIDGTMPSKINHVRLGESILLGRETAYGELLPGLNPDVFCLKAEVIESGVKPSRPEGITGMDAFGQVPATGYGDSKRRRALLGIGREDTVPEGLCPCEPGIKVLGGSSDHLIIDIEDYGKPCEPGDIIAFRMSYPALLGGMTSSYVNKDYRGISSVTPLINGIRIAGMPISIGANRPGSELAPQAVCAKKLKEKLAESGHQVEDCGNIVSPVLYDAGLSPEQKAARLIAANDILAKFTMQTLDDNRFPLVVGGDHSITAGILSGLRQIRKDSGMIMFSAFGEFNDEKTSVTGNLQGMALASCCNRCGLRMVSIPPSMPVENIVLIGLRNVDSAERKLLRQSGIKIFSMEDIDVLGMHEVITQSCRALAHCADGIHVSIGMNFADPAEAPGVLLASRGGVNYREAHLAMETLAATAMVCSADLTELAPVDVSDDPTAGFGVELLCSLLGQKII